MTSSVFAALGFDPAPGDPARVEALAVASSGAAGAIGVAADRLAAARAVPDWTGDAASAFDVEIGRLPADLDHASAAYGRVGSALRSYGSELRDAQAEALRLEDLASRAATRAHATLVGDPAEQFRARADAAAEQADIQRSAHRLRDRLVQAGDRAAALVRAAGETPPYHCPGFLARATAAVDGWIDDNADALRTASAALKAVSAGAGLLAFVPVLRPFCAPLAAGTSAAATGVDAALAAAGHGRWRTVAIEALASLGAGGRAIRVVGTATRRGDDVASAPTRVVNVHRVEGRGNERIRIDPAANVTINGRRRCLFLNFGSINRAEELLAQRRRKGFDDNVIKSFDVDAEFLDHLRRIAVAEEDTRRLGSLTFRCDVSRAPDQYGLRRAQIDELIPHIVPGSGRAR